MAESRLTDKAEGSFLVFCSGDRRYALPTKKVMRVAEIRTISPLPSDLGCNLGLVIHRGVVVGLLDLERLLTANAADPESRPRGSAIAPELPCLCIFARFRRGVAGFPVDEIVAIETPDPLEPWEEIEILDLDLLEALS